MTLIYPDVDIADTQQRHTFCYKDLSIDIAFIVHIAARVVVITKKTAAISFSLSSPIIHYRLINVGCGTTFRHRFLINYTFLSWYQYGA